MDREVWIVFPRTARARIAAVRERLRRECHTRRWGLQEVIPSVERLISGRRLMLVAGEDAVKLYRRSHRAKVGVFHTGRARVQLMPCARSSMAVAQFIRYKAYASPLPADVGAVSRCLDAYDAWCQSIGCVDGHDPRCLPFHVFESGHTELGTSKQRQHFDEVHGVGALRRDGKRLMWRLDPAVFHGRETLQVAGYALSRGFHWDVSVDNGRSPTVTTPTERWEISRKSGYLNVYPDGHVRGRAPYARKLRIPRSNRT